MQHEHSKHWGYISVCCGGFSMWRISQNFQMTKLSINSRNVSSLRNHLGAINPDALLFRFLSSISHPPSWERSALNSVWSRNISSLTSKAVWHDLVWRPGVQIFARQRIPCTIPPVESLLSTPSNRHSYPMPTPVCDPTSSMQTICNYSSRFMTTSSTIISIHVGVRISSAQDLLLQVMKQTLPIVHALTWVSFITLDLHILINWYYSI